METPLQYEDLPWQLIIAALQEELTPEESERFGNWLAGSPANQATYQQLKQVWNERLTDYILYEAADENKAWEALQQLLDGPAGLQEDKTVFHPRLADRLTVVRRWTLAAVLAFLTIGIGLWQFLGRPRITEYASAAGEQRTIPLSDGSKVVLGPQTRLALHSTFNKTDRTVVLVGGQAQFDVVHYPQQPFIVDMDAASVRDIGTSFIITKNQDSTTVTVSAGKVAFTDKASGKTRELSAGASLCLYTSRERHGEMKMIAAGGGSLRFDNVPLSEVAGTLQKQFGKTITLQDTSLAPKKLTVNLDGESFDQCVRVICASLDLQSAPDSGGGIVLSAHPPVSPNK